MKKFASLLCMILCISFLFTSVASASYGTFQYEDDRFVGEFTTENLDRIIDEYELYDSWYWTTAPRVDQTFHGADDAPGWTDTAVNKNGGRAFVQNQYGCRWLANRVNPDVFGGLTGGYGECFGFAQFIGYLLSGDYNPYKTWTYYSSLDAAGGLQVGDILRTNYKNGHSAIVYSVTDDEILFLQVSGGSYNRISVGAGFLCGYPTAITTLDDIRKLPASITIRRSPLNQSSQGE